MKKVKYNNKTILKYLVIVYLILSPIFDLIFLYNHVTTFIRLFCLISLLVYTLIIYNDSRKKSLWLLAYYLAICGFLIIDYFHARGFSSLVPGNFNYSIISEAATLLKLATPFTLLFVLKYQDISKKDFFKIINMWIIFIAGSIVVCNFVGYSLSSYTNEITKYRIFSWNGKLPVELIATKGFFSYANQVAVVLLMLLVFAIYEFCTINKSKIIYIILIVLSSLMLGTRISTMGGLLVLTLLSMGYFIYYLLFKKTFCRKVLLLCLLIIFWIVMLPISPNKSRLQEMENASEILFDNSNNELSPLEDDKSSQDYILSELESNKLLGEQFYLTFYPYQYDKDFWIDIINNHMNDVSNYRFLEKKIIARIWSIDNRWTNYLFGISNTRIQNVVNIESDFILHYYAFGIIGSVVLLLFYISLPVVIIKKLYKSKSLIDLSILCSFALFILGSFISGNSINFLATIVPMTLLVSRIGIYKD